MRQTIISLFSLPFFLSRILSRHRLHLPGVNCRSVDRLRSEGEVSEAAKACQDLKLDALVLVGSARTVRTSSEK